MVNHGRFCCLLAVYMIHSFKYFLDFVSGVAGLDQYVYAIGGYDSTYQLSSVERYDIETNQWECIVSMNQPRSALSIAVTNSKIYALGKS